MKRAIAIFLENKENLINDFWGLYFSLKYIKSNDTDLVVFGPKDVLEKIPNDCVKVECNPISYEFPWTNSKLPSTYHFINSIYFLCTPQAEILLDYDYVLKTDADTFLTPHWNNYYPENYSTGYSCYINDQITMDKIKEVANELNLQSKGEHIHRVGASHYGKPQLIIDIMKLTYEISQYMLENIFKDDIGKWPGWFYGVTSMYAGEIAVNHLIEKFSRDIYKIDYPNNDIEGKTKTENAVHIHSHHSFNLFSKFNFNKGEYDNIDISTLDISIVKNYSLYMALSGKKLKMENNMENNAKQNNFTSIIILTWNNLRYTKECIESIREHTNKELYEIIVVDNNSTDGTVDWLKGETDLKCIFNETNNGFSKGNNQGIEIAIGDSILFLNNDVVATPNWLFNLRIALFSSERIGAVGPLTNYAFGQAITVPYPLEDMSEMTKFAKDNNYSNPAGWEEKLKLIGFCMLVKMDTVKKIGGLDESFSPAHFEDDDYCYRILSEGYKILLCRDTFVHHYGSKSIITLPNNGWESVDKGRITFYKKWGFDSIIASISKYDIVNLINEPLDKALNILEIGCGCGGTLLCCKYKFKNSNLYGVEKNSNSAKFSSTFANVLNIDLDIDELSFDKDFFDVIIISDMLENFKNPIEILQNIKLYLKQGGKFITSNENKKFLEIGRQIKENKIIEEKEQIEKEKFTAEKKLKIFHTASFAPNAFGLYEAARDAFRADSLAGHDVYFVDTGYLENGERKYTPIGSIDDRAGFKLITSDPTELDNADIIIAHTMPNHDWIARNQVPIIYVVHDRPLYSFKITNDVKSFTNTSEVSLQPRVKKMLYFWPEFKPFWRTFPQEKHAILDYPVVDQIRFSPEGEKHIIKDEHKGEWNILICDSWGREIDVFEIINGAIQAAIDIKNIKFHIYGVEAVDGKLPSQWNLLLQQLVKLGATGEICGRTTNMEQIYRSMDCVLTPHRIVTRIIGESLSCGIPVIAAIGCKVTEYLCDPQDPQTVSDEIKRFINSDREQSKKNALEQSKKFSSENYSREMEKIYNEVLNKKKAEEKSTVEDKKMTFTIIAPTYVHNSAGVECLYRLSTLLTELGHETYIYNYQQLGIETPDKFRGIPITDNKLRGIPIAPEVVNSLDFPHVRWILNYPGKLNGAPKTYNENVMAVYYLDKFRDETLIAAKSGIIHKFCIGNIELIKPTEQVEKTLTLWYRGKYSQQIDVSKHKYQLELTRFWPPEKQQYWELLHKTKELYSYDGLTGVTLEAYHCGVNVFIYNSQANKWDSYIPEDSLSEAFINHEVDLEKTKQFVNHCDQWYNNLPK